MEPEVLHLVRQSKNGKKEAFGKLYTLYLKKVYRFIYYMIYDTNLAADLTQDTFFKVWKSIRSYQEGKGSFATYLFAIARNVVIDHQRKKKESHIDPQMEETIPSGENIEEQVIAKEKRQEVRNSLSKLDGDNRQLILFRYFEELSIPDIGRILGKEEGNVRVLIFRALKKLKKIMEEKI